ncbi:MAG: DUF445 domain-containing protein [Actinomycetota bacterium]|nr:DUF445 domain-containing protein [Actinomycetota bacterium]
MSDVERADALRKMKIVATGLFVLALFVFVVAEANEERATWIGYVRAFSEAAMIGALADWFAVTALFRHPLGIPIPHTAIVRHRKDEIGRGLGEFVEDNFLSRDVLDERLAEARLAERIGTWLAEPANARRLADALADAVAGVVEVLDDTELQDGIERAVERRVQRIEAAPLAAKVLDASITSGHHQRLLDAVLVGLDGFLDDNRQTFRSRLEEESPWWVPESIDDRIFEKIYDAVSRFITDVGADPDHEVRKSIDRRLAIFVVRLAEDPELARKAEQLKAELLEHPEVRAWIGSLWAEMREGITRLAAEPHGELRQRISASLERIGARLVTDADLQHRVDGWLERGIHYIVEHYRNEVTNFIATTIERWDPETTSRRMELQVGRDLQFIRINGTIVGGLAGLVIHTITELTG